MIPIKKLKYKLLQEFKAIAVELEIRTQTMRISNKLVGHHLNIPYWFSDGGTAIIRWNIKRNRFDKITFKAFGKLHRIKL